MDPADGTAERRAAVVYNPIKVDEDQLRAEVARAESENGWGESRWYATSVEDVGSGVAREALDDGADVVLAAGGDGTVRAVAETLRGSGVPIALLPSGTGNLLARNLDLDLDHLPGSVDTAFAGGDRPIDLGIVEAERADGAREEFAFLVMAGIGIDADMAAGTDPKLKKKVGWLAYIDPIMRSARKKNRLRIRYRLDDHDARSMRVHTILIGNCGSLPGNVLLLPEAAVDDGLFDIVALRPEGVRGWVQITWKIVWENGVLRRTQVGRKLMSRVKEVRALRYLKGARFTMRFDSPQEFELDGDPYGEVVALRATVDAGGLIVKVPGEPDPDAAREHRQEAEAARS